MGDHGWSWMIMMLHLDTSTLNTSLILPYVLRNCLFQWLCWNAFKSCKVSRKATTRELSLPRRIPARRRGRQKGPWNSSDQSRTKSNVNQAHLQSGRWQAPTPENSHREPKVPVLCSNCKMLTCRCVFTKNKHVTTCHKLSQHSQLTTLYPFKSASRQTSSRPQGLTSLQG